MLLDVRAIFHGLKPNLGTCLLLILAAILFTGLSGCSSDSGDGTSPIAESFPADGATNAGVLDSISLRMKEPLKASLLSEATATLIASDSSEILTLTPSYSPFSNTVGYTLVLATPRPLTYATQYQLQVDGLRTESDTALDAFTLSFTTHNVPTQASREIRYDGDGNIIQYYRFDRDTEQKIIRKIWFLGAGADGIWFTEDDADDLRSYEHNFYDDRGKLIQQAYYSNAGIDGIWLSADDQPNSYEDYTQELNIDGQPTPVITTYGSSGPDGQWFTDDDAFPGYEYQTQETLTNGVIRKQTITLNDIGPDGILFTSDDNIRYRATEENEQGRQLFYIHYTGVGLDGIWFTADDTAAGVVNLKDDNDRTLISATISGNGAMGADGKWLTGDETLYGFSYAEYDADGNQTRNAQFNGKGADGKWFTSDDVPQAYNYWEREYNAQAQTIKDIDFDPSHAPADPAFSASHLDSYTIYSADLSNAVNVYFAGLGADGEAFTADDVAAWPYSVQLSDGYDQYNMPGADGTWFTADDVLSGYIRWQYSGNRKIREDRYNAAD